MEDALVPTKKEILHTFKHGLNPCFNGRCTSTLNGIAKGRLTPCLNPCFNGRCTSTVTTKRASLLKLKNVLILVLMEDALVHAVENLLDSTNLVLILVLMEDALVRS